MDDRIRILVCQTCGSEFEFVRKPGAPARFCSDSCRREARRAQSLATYYADVEKYRERGRERARERHRRDPEHRPPSQDPAYRRAKLAEKRGSDVRQYVCIICGNRFERPHKPGRPPKVCSKECRAEDNRRQAKAWYHKNPERVAQQPTRQPARRKEINVAYYKANREQEIQRSLAYMRGPGREAKRARDAARFALTRGAPNADRFTLDEIFERDAAVCHLCGELVERASATMDHVIPVTRGGPHTLANVKLAHRSCNTRKSNRV